MDWKESKFYAWLRVARDDEWEGMKLMAHIRTHAFHDPKELGKMFARKDMEFPSKEERQETLRKAAKIRKLELREARIGEII